MTPAALSQLGISKTITITSTYDHRVIQGAESGLFLARIHELLIGQHDFYDEIFRDLEINYPPLRWAQDYNPSSAWRRPVCTSRPRSRRTFCS